MLAHLTLEGSTSLLWDAAPWLRADSGGKKKIFEICLKEKRQEKGSGLIWRTSPRAVRKERLCVSRNGLAARWVWWREEGEYEAQVTWESCCWKRIWGRFPRLPFLLFNSQPHQVNIFRFELWEAIRSLYSWKSPHFEYFRVNCLFFLMP